MSPWIAVMSGSSRLLPRFLATPAPSTTLRTTNILLARQLRAPSRPATGAAAGARPAASRCVATRSQSATTQPFPDKKRVVFCGTPEVAALVLQRLLTAAAQPNASFEVAAVVTQPPRPTGRGNRKVPQPSPVQVVAQEAGMSAAAILAPERPGDAGFLAALQQLAPDLCVTAAYGNYLPTSFLAIPPHGTLNIHPSLLPKYRGAAPVQRALQDGVAVSGVSLLYTVRAMDAGPILAQQELKVDPDVQAPELLTQLFELGTDLLVKNLEVVWAGMGDATAQPQDEAGATHAAKLTRQEAELDFSQPAQVCHNKVRGFAGWPGTFATFQQQAAESSSSDSSSSSSNAGHTGEMELKIVRTRMGRPSEWTGSSERQVVASRDALLIRCGDGSVLQVLELQAPGKRVMAAKDFLNGLKGRTLVWQPAQHALQPAGIAV
ncbi:Methionyl-tRNA formyltransferase [Chlorella vulgaris]